MLSSHILSSHYPLSEKLFYNLPHDCVSRNLCIFLELINALKSRKCGEVCDEAYIYKVYNIYNILDWVSGMHDLNYLSGFKVS